MKAKQCYYKTKQKYYNAHGVYLHGEIESDCKFDCVMFANCKTIKLGNELCAKLTPGVHPIIVIGSNRKRKAAMFIWESTNPNSNNFGYPWMGLIVYINDEEAFNYALECFNNKEQSL